MSLCGHTPVLFVLYFFWALLVLVFRFLVIVAAIVCAVVCLLLNKGQIFFLVYLIFHILYLVTTHIGYQVCLHACFAQTHTQNNCFNSVSGPKWQITNNSTNINKNKQDNFRDFSVIICLLKCMNEFYCIVKVQNEWIIP